MLKTRVSAPVSMQSSSKQLPVTHHGTHSFVTPDVSRERRSLCNGSVHTRERVSSTSPQSDVIPYVRVLTSFSKSRAMSLSTSSSTSRRMDVLGKARWSTSALTRPGVPTTIWHPADKCTCPSQQVQHSSSDQNTGTIQLSAQ